MITVHKTEIARQNNSQYFLRPTPQKIYYFPQIMFSGEPQLPRSSHPAHQDGHFNVILCVILPLKRNKLHF